MKPVAWALYWKEGDLCRVTTNEADALSFIPYNKGQHGATPLYAIPEGYKLVPVEPTEAMLIAGGDVDATPDKLLKLIYKAMIAAIEGEQ